MISASELKKVISSLGEGVDDVDVDEMIDRSGINKPVVVTCDQLS